MSKASQGYAIINAEPLKRAWEAAEADLLRSYGGDHDAMIRAWPAFLVLLLRAELEAREDARFAAPFVRLSERYAKGTRAAVRAGAAEGGGSAMTRFEYRRLELELAAAQSAVDSLATGKFPDAYELAVRARDVAQARFTAATPPPPDPEQPMVEAQRDATEHWARVDADALARADAAGTSAAA